MERSRGSSPEAKNEWDGSQPSEEHVRALASRPVEQAGPLLVELCCHPDAMIRVAAIETLGLSGYHVGIPTLCRLLAADRRVLVRVCAAEAIGNLGRDREDANSTLRRSVRTDRNALVRAWAADALGRLGRPDSISFLRREVATEPVPHARLSIYGALARLGDDQATRELIAMLRRTRKAGLRSTVLGTLEEVLTLSNADLIIPAVERLANEDSDYAFAPPRFQMRLAVLRGATNG